jgi:hypothetical protein
MVGARGAVALYKEIVTCGSNKRILYYMVSDLHQQAYSLRAAFV